MDLSNRAQSAVKLKITDTALIPVDFFTPSDYKTLNDGADLDYGSLAAFLIPNSHFYLTGAKDGKIYVALVNANPKQELEVAVNLGNEKVSSAKGRILTAPLMDTHNTFEKPETIKPAPFSASAKNGKLSVKLTAKSVVVVAVE